MANRDLADNEAAEEAALNESEYVCRAILRKFWIDPITKELLPDAFILDPDDEGCLSVNNSPGCSEEFLTSYFRKCYGANGLALEIIAQLGLSVHDDPQESGPRGIPNTFHACLAGLPDPSTDVTATERIAGLLAKASYPLWR